MAVQGLQEGCAQGCHSCPTPFAKGTSSAPGSTRSVTRTCSHRASDARDPLTGGGAQLHNISPYRQGRISSVVSFSGGSPIEAVESSGEEKRASTRLSGHSGSNRLFCSPRGIVLRILDEICPPTASAPARWSMIKMMGTGMRPAPHLPGHVPFLPSPSRPH